MKKIELVDCLSRLSEAELIEVFYSAFESRKICHDGDIDDAYCISNSGYYPYDGVHTSEFLALPVEKIDIDKLEIKNTSFSGQCSKCKAIVACISINAICPICSNHVDCN